MKAIRHGLPPSQPPPPPGGPKPLTPEGKVGDGDSLRGWEVWWELNRDRFVPRRASDVAIDVAHVPADQRTSIQVDGDRVGSYERIEPVLRLILQHDKADLVRSRALISLAELGEDPRASGSRKTYATILPYLYGSDAQLTEAAITALGILGTEDAIFPLAQWIEGTDESDESKAKGRAARAPAPARATDRQRALAFYSIGLIGRDSEREDVRRLAASRICSLFAAEPDAPAEVRFAALHGLSLVAVSDHVEPEEPAQRPPVWSDRRAARAAARAKTIVIPAASRGAEIAWTLSVLDDEHEAGWIRAQAVTAAARLCEGLPEQSAARVSVVERLLKTLAPHSPETCEVEQSAALALGELGDGDNDELDARVRVALADALANASDRSTREFALLSLALVGSRPGGGEGDEERLVAATDVRRFLLHRAASAKAGELPWTVLALGVLEHGLVRAGVASSREARVALNDLLVETHSAEDACACALALGLAGGTEGVAELTSRLRDGDAHVRGSAALALGMLGAREAAPALERLLTDARTTPELYAPVSEALALLGAPVSRQLVGMMAGGASLESQMNLCTALGKVGDNRSLRAVSEVACDNTTLVWVRAAAASALGAMANRRPERWNADLGYALNFLMLPPTLSSASLDGLLDRE
ncbi:MAG TPA: HEAT repeat domain-containing protein [Planctomycetota bacterium]|nr:HEAT repeat domain-containing protein [Planctomycetota bacterium]